MQIDTQSHLLKDATYIPSPNCDDREEGEWYLTVVHNISLPPDQFGGDGVVQLFTNKLDPFEHPYYATISGLEVSSHVFIRRDGEVIQFVPFDKRAWHAGVSHYQGREKCNEFSVGIELEGCDSKPFEDVQYHVLAEVIQALCTAYPDMAYEHITGHSDIAPGRKTDPGPFFNWAKLRDLLP